MRRYLVPVVAFLLIVAGGVAIAQTGDGDLIAACVQRNNGQLRIVADADDCRNSETYLEWNSEGAPGPAGPPGAPGTPGVDGEDGADGQDGVDGVSGYFIAESSCHEVASGAWAAINVYCPAGKKVLGGGAHWSSNSTCTGYAVTPVDVSHPQGDNAWRASGINPYSGSHWFRVYAICADVD